MTFRYGKAAFRYFVLVLLCFFCLGVAFFIAPRAGAEEASGSSSLLAAGKEHTLALKADGTVWAWGGNAYGQLGDGTGRPSNLPVRVQGIKDVVAVAAGNYHSLALKADGTVWAWGSNLYGQLGDGTDKNRHTPVRVGALSEIIAVAGGGVHSLAIARDGMLWAWGANTYGQLGDGRKADPDSRQDELLSRWYRGEYYGDGQEIFESLLPVRSFLRNIESISAGGFTTLGVTGTGILRGWGANWRGQLGQEKVLERVREPNTENWFFYDRFPVTISGITGVSLAACGLEHTVALKLDGTVWTLGGNVCGQLGHGDTRDTDTPGMVKNLRNIRSVAAGSEHTLALDSTGRVWAWGANTYGQLGDGTMIDRYEPVRVKHLDNVIAVAAGSEHSLALTKNGSVWCWGNNLQGQLGNSRGENSTLPLQSLINLQPPTQEQLPAKDDEIKILINLAYPEFELPPVLEGDRILAPFRGIGEYFGAQVAWDGGTKEITYVAGNLTLVISPGSGSGKLNGRPVTLETPPRIINGHAYVPLRFLGELLGASVRWEPETKTIIIFSGR